MDGAIDRVDLRGLSLLIRCRTLRRDDAERARSKARHEVDAAQAEAMAADERLAAHRRAWRDKEVTSLASMTDRTLDGGQFRRARDELDAMADAAIRLQWSCLEARKRVEAAELQAETARLHLAVQQRRLQQSDTIHGRVSTMREALYLALDEQELDDDLSQRFGRRG